jgi:hypothetical protein
MARFVSIRMLLLMLAIAVLVVGNARGESIVSHGQARAAAEKWEQIIDYPSNPCFAARIYDSGGTPNAGPVRWDEELQLKGSSYVIRGCL